MFVIRLQTYSRTSNVTLMKLICTLTLLTSNINMYNNIKKRIGIKLELITLNKK